MSTYRERREAKADKLREWAEKRETKAAAVFEANKPFTSDYAFNTQPGHIPLRARIIAQEDRAHESLSKARSMASRADGIERGLKESIYSDDPDAIDALKARIAALEAERDGIKAENAAFRKAHRAELAKLSAYDRDHAMPHRGYVLTNLTGNIKRNKDRLVDLERRADKAARSEEAGGTLVEEHPNGYASVTFAEKPERETINALKVAGFRWSGGSWFGRADAIPAEVRP